ncbi:MAG: RdgB/HAM1 family non-canonical purine NTP pyrophosphatase [Candidatus Villigracilaceae bacterium]
MTELLIATHNRGKLREIQAILSDLRLTLLTPDDLGLALEVVEDGLTYAENAAKKAVLHAKAAGLPALADDSGLEVEALGGAPGIYSARYAPKAGASDADRRAYLLQNLAGKPRPWKARFCAAVAIALPEGNVRIANGECAGVIIPEERGLNGFGYDPIFLLPKIGKTMAELDEDDKNRISHRARALQNARPILEEWLF